MLRVPLVVAGFCSSAAILLGQTVSSGVFLAQVPADTVGAIAFSGSIGTMLGVTGAPFSGTRESETSQTLADGTHIARKVMLEKIWRDSEGRMRTEHSLIFNPLTQPPHTIIWISDPVAGYRYTLDPQNKVAHRMALSQGAVLPPRLPAQTQPSQSSTIKAAGGGVGGTSSTGPAISSTGPQTTHESLGTKTFDGLLVEGTRFTSVLPEGAVGNDRPITPVSESWYSPDLKEINESTHSDPRTGESVMRLTNIDRNDPDPSLFEVPAGYEIIDDPGTDMRIQQH
jgi:hypothetical protein